MIDVRKVLLILLFLPAAFIIVTGQNLDIQVLGREAGPLPYAFVMVNGRLVQVTDTLGNTTIPGRLLTGSDTISVTYAGMSTASVVCDRNLRRKKKHIFLLESEYPANRNALTQQDFEILFRENVIRLPEVNYNCMMNAKFYARVVAPRLSEPLYGTLEAANDFRFLPKKYGWFDRSLRFEANRKTENELGRTLESNTHMALYLINRSLSVCSNGTGRFIRSFYSYLGEKGECRVFRIVFSQKNKADYYYQILLFANSRTRYLQSVRVEAVSHATGDKNNLYKFSTLFDCGLFTSRKPSLNTIYLPENVYYSYQPDDNFRFDLMMSDVSIRYKKFYR